MSMTVSGPPWVVEIPPVSGAGNDADVVAFAARIVAAGGSIDAPTVAALDAWVKAGRQDGWYSKLVEVWPFVGNTLAAALQKLKYTTAQALTNNNFVEADYNQLDGFGNLASNSNKYLASGFVPGSNGIVYTSCSLLFEPLGYRKDLARSSTWGSLAFLVGSIGQSAADPTLLVADQATGMGSFPNRIDYSPDGVTLYNADSSGIVGYVGEAQTRSGGGAPTSATYPHEVTVHSSKRSNNTTYFATGKHGLIAIGNALTVAECDSIVAATKRLGEQIRRRKNRVGLLLGDSITMRTGSTTYETAWGDMLLARVGCDGVRNQAQGSSGLNSTATSSVPNFKSVVSRIGYALQDRASVVGVVIGTNDMGADAAVNGNATTITNYTNVLTYCLRELRRACGGRVVVGTPPYRSDTGAHSLTKQAAYAAAAASAAKLAGVPLADLYRKFTDKATPASGLADGLHPNDTGHQWMYEAMKDAHDGLLTRSPSLDFSASTTAAVTVLNAVSGMPVRVTPLSAPSVAGTTFVGVVSADDTVTVTASANVAPQYFRIEVLCGY